MILEVALSAYCIQSSKDEKTDAPVIKQLQKSVKKKVSAQGIGLFTGKKGEISLCPAPPNHGIVFQRVDLPGKPRIPALLDYIQAMTRCTALAQKGCLIQTVEHLLAALYGCGVDNLLVEVSGNEVPVFDGSAAHFVDLIQEAGVEEFSEEKAIGTLEVPQFFSQEDVQLIALPDEHFRVSYALHYPQAEMLCSQFYSAVITEEHFIREIAPCRTFSVYEEVEPFIKAGLIKGGSLDNAVVIKENKVINPEGTRFRDEMVRHKILDLLGDFSILGCSLKMHIIAIRSGHASNIAFAKSLQKLLKVEKSK